MTDHDSPTCARSRWTARRRRRDGAYSRPMTTSRASTSVLVIGGGVAGLAAAWRLKAAGVDATILEARGRVGGRAYSGGDGFSEGQRWDLGGELINKKYTEIPALCA